MFHTNELLNTAWVLDCVDMPIYSQFSFRKKVCGHSVNQTLCSYLSDIIPLVTWFICGKWATHSFMVACKTITGRVFPTFSCFPGRGSAPTSLYEHLIGMQRVSNPSTENQWISTPAHLNWWRSESDLIRMTDACATPQWRPRHELACIWTDFLSEQHRTTDFVETAAGHGANDSLHDVYTRLTISSQ